MLGLYVRRQLYCTACMHVEHNHTGIPYTGRYANYDNEAY